MAAARLSHPGIVAIYDVIVADEVPHVVMEYVKGRTLAELIAAGGLPVHDAVRLVQQVCRAVEYAHGEGVVHRDIKSSNILVDPGGAAKLGDFGVARIVDKPTADRGVVIGTPAYMAPEQLNGGGADERSDLFSLGVVLYEAVTGHSPFPGDDLATVLYEITHGTPMAARERNRAVSLALDAVIARALSKEPEDRYPGARAFADALECALVASRRWTSARWNRPAPGVVRGAVAAVAAVAVSATLGVIASRMGGQPETAAPRIPAAIESGLASGAVSGGPLIRAVAARPRAAEGSGATAARLPAATVVIETNPAVDVFVDGALRGRTRERALVVRDVPVGVREITLKLGDRERTLTGTLRDGQTLTLAYTFGESRPVAPDVSAPKAQPSSRVGEAAPVKETTGSEREIVAATGESFGCLSVNAVPFAAVYVDGQHVGDTPRACLRVRTGARSLRFQSAEGQSAERSIVVTAEHTRDNPLRVSYDFHVRQFIGP
jgi:hypothetical protein